MDSEHPSDAQTFLPDQYKEGRLPVSVVLC